MEHIFIGNLLQYLWQQGIYDVEVLRSEFDAGGYDLVITQGSLTRHVQLKSKRIDGRTSYQKIGMALGDRASGCVICFEIDDDLNVLGYLWYGDTAGKKLPDISGFKIASHTKANKDGVKNKRIAHRNVPMSKFERLTCIKDVVSRLLDHT